MQLRRALFPFSVLAALSACDARRDKSPDVRPVQEAAPANGQDTTHKDNSTDTTTKQLLLKARSSRNLTKQFGMFSKPRTMTIGSEATTEACTVSTARHLSTSR